MMGKQRGSGPTIEALEAENTALRSRIADLQKRFDKVNDFEHSQCAGLLLKLSEKDKQLARVTVERDAALKDLRGKCCVCIHYTPNHHEGTCANCSWDYAPDAPSSDCWQWRGPQKEDGGNDA